MSIEAHILKSMFGDMCLAQFNMTVALAKTQEAGKAEADALRDKLRETEERMAALEAADKEDRDGAP